MAVKQHIPETVEESVKPNVEMSGLVALLETIRTTNQCTTVNELMNFCGRIVLALSKIPVDRDPDNVKRLLTEVPVIHSFFQDIYDNRNENYLLIVQSCLKILYQIITTDSETEPSQMVSITLQIVDESFIPTAVLWILNQENKSDVAIKKGFGRLCNWAKKNDITPSLHLWILEILHQLMVR